MTQQRLRLPRRDKCVCLGMCVCVVGVAREGSVFLSLCVGCPRGSVLVILTWCVSLISVYHGAGQMHLWV